MPSTRRVKRASPSRSGRRAAPRGPRPKAKPSRARAKTARGSQRRPATRVAARRPAAARQTAKSPPAPRPAMAGPNAIGCASQHMDYTSHTMDEVKRFYTETLGFSNFQHDPKANYLFVVTGPSSSLGFMPPMPGPPELWRPPREPAIYLMVRDVDRAHADLVAKGAVFQQAPTDMPWGHRVAILRDPEGRTVCLAEQRAR